MDRELDAGLYGPGSEAWRLNREATLLLGAGPRALLLQIAHPAVAAGVDEHSGFRSDPWGRLAATLRSYLTIVYGTSTAARAEIRRLNALHRGIVGPGYSAHDPELSMWVHATLIDSTIVANHAWIEPLSRARRSAFYLETRPIGRALGVPDDLLPGDLHTFEAYVEGMLALDGPVQVSPVAAHWQVRSSGRRWRRSRTGCRSGRGRRMSWQGCRPPPTTGRCGQPWGYSRIQSARRTGCAGVGSNSWSAAGWLPVGERGARSSQRSSARCRAHWQRIGG